MKRAVPRLAGADPARAATDQVHGKARAGVPWPPSVIGFLRAILGSGSGIVPARPPIVVFRPRGASGQDGKGAVKRRAKTCARNLGFFATDPRISETILAPSLQQTTDRRVKRPWKESTAEAGRKSAGAPMTPVHQRPRAASPVVAAPQAATAV